MFGAHTRKKAHTHTPQQDENNGENKRVSVE